ncbi:hypothetical protein [Brevibacillus sp. NRS-1366]|uniref:hypothetical protein n=1 Tax=Brevibacillus sp. NRS-1366 TaxID=3233899 RepID=UPI003D231E22
MKRLLLLFSLVVTFIFLISLNQGATAKSGLDRRYYKAQGGIYQAKSDRPDL